jgi:signal transduction histidine kinase/tetratricopeptide (TPR) repeat protein
VQRLHERYRVIERIGDGGVGAVFRVEDEATGHIVAMKVLPREASGGLRGEFLALARLRHDNIVSVLDYGRTDGGQDFFTMEYVVGPPLLAAVSEVPSPAFYQLIGGVLRALAFVHARGMVHADIKPSNILVDGDQLPVDPVGAARLVDFGLAAHMTDPTSQAARGTLLYAAPEVFAGRLDARSDLYAVGVVLYQMATGQLPFPHSDARALVAAQRRGPPGDPRLLRPDLPAGLAELMLGLLDPVPGARPQTADEVLARINDIAGTDFAIADSRPLIDVGGVMFGREAELDRLDQLWREAGAGRGGVALISGEPGLGVSRLLREHKLAVQMAGGRVLGTSARDPLLGGVALPIGTSSGEALSDREDRFARADAAAEALFELAAGGPFLFLVDDVEQADQATAELLGYLARAAEDGPLLVCLGVSGAAPRLAALIDDLPPARRLELAPLDRPALAQLVEHAFSDAIARALTTPLHRASGGNPSHAARALESMVDSGQLARERGAWVLRDDDLQIAPPPDADMAAAARLDRLSAPARTALRALSVLGDRFDRSLAARLCGEAIDVALADGIALRLIEGDAAAGRYELASAAAQRLLYAELGDGERERLHRLAARLFEERAAAGATPPPAELARHYLALGERAAGVRWGRRAAEERTAALDLRGALEWYRRLEPLCDPAETGPLLERIGDLSAALGEIEPALAAYERSHGLSPLPLDRIRLAGLAADLLRRKGEGDRAVEVLMSALELARQNGLGQAEIQTHLRIGRVLWYRGEYKAALEHAVAGQLLARLRGDRRALADLARLEAQIAVSRGDSRAAVAHYDSALREAEDLGDATLVAQIQLQLGFAAVYAGDYARAITALETSLPLHRSTGRVEKVAAALNNLGIAHYQRGEWAAARDAWEQFRRLCERLGEKSELVSALNNLGALYRELGELNEALAVLDRAAALAEATGHAHMAAMITGNRGEVLFRLGELSAAGDCYARARGEFERIGARDDLVETDRRACELALATGRVREALDRIVDVARSAREVGARLEEGVAHRVAAAALRLNQDLDSAEWFCERAGELLTALGARYHLARVEVERAELAAARGQTARAMALFAAAAEVLAELGARWDLGRVRARLAELERPRTRRASGPLIIGEADQGGLQLLVDLARASTHLPIDQVLEQALDSLLDLTGHDRGFLLLLDSEGQPRERTRRVRAGARGFARDDAHFSGSIVRKVAASGEAIAIDDIAGEVDLRQQRSVIALGLHSAMCAPLRARGRLLGVAYVDSQGEPAAISLPLFEAFTSHLALLIDNARLQADDARKSELMAVLAHEIRNPLAAMLGFSDIGRVEVTDADAVDLFGRIHRDGERLSRLVNNVMDLVRHDTGKLDWSSTAVDVDQLLTAAVESFRPLCRDKEIELSLELDEPACRALGNEDRLMQVVSNLLGNACKFTPRRGRVAVRARRESVSDADPDSPPAPASELRAWSPFAADDEVHDVVRVDVTDTGPGMSAEECRQLFDKFAQGPGQRRSTGGVGLGLYISREIILRHGGSIWASSAPGQGATFSFRIPVA